MLLFFNATQSCHETEGAIAFFSLLCVVYTTEPVGKTWFCLSEIGSLDCCHLLAVISCEWQAVPPSCRKTWYQRRDVFVRGKRKLFWLKIRRHGSFIINTKMFHKIQELPISIFMVTNDKWKRNIVFPYRSPLQMLMLTNDSLSFTIFPW